MKLYSYYRSSAAYRVRIALNLKELTHDILPIHLVRNGGEQHSESFASINPAELVPVLEDGSLVINQSMAILEYLEEAYPIPNLLPSNINERAKVRAFSYDISHDIHPINNLRVLQFLTNEMGILEQQKQQWIQHWINLGFQNIETRLSKEKNLFCFSETPSIADCCLIPQVYNAIRFNVDMKLFPNINRVYETCNELAAFEKAKPENQIDS